MIAFAINDSSFGLLVTVLVFYCQVPGTTSAVTCVNSSPISDYVEATRSTVLEGVGCLSRELATSPHQGKSVYVFLLDDTSAHKKRRSVSLNINPSKDGRKQSILVLASSQPMLWKLHSTSRVKLNIVVSNVTLVHKDGSIVDTMTYALVPSDSTQLLQWVRQQYGGVTAFTASPPDTNTIALTLQGDISGRSARCSPVPSFRSPVIVSTNISPVPVVGCVTRSQTGGKDVHVVELMSETLSEVMVSLRGGGRGTPVSRHLVLILHSHSAWRTDPAAKKTRWIVMTTLDIRGEIDIITEGSVDTGGVAMHTVRVVNGERLEPYTGASLVQWATITYGGPPFTYTVTEQANHLSITITNSEEGEDTGGKYSDDVGMSSGSLLSQHTVTCKDTHMVVTLVRTAVTADMEGRLTLLDPLCTAIHNDTHFILRSGYEQCGSTVTHNGSIENEIVLRGEGEERHVTGGNSRQATDDAGHRVTFQCPRLSGQGHVAGSYQEQQVVSPAYTLQSCDANYDVCGEKFIERMQAGGRLHVQAEALSVGSEQRVVVDSCWLSATQSLAEMPLMWLIVKSCNTEASLQWHDSPSGSAARFSFTVDPGASTKPVYIHCRLALCHPQPTSEAIPQCKTREKYCMRTLGIQFQTVLTTSTSLGPISIEKGKTLASSSSGSSSKHVTTVVGADIPTVIVIAFAAFAIGILFTGVMWLIHAHTGQRKSCAGQRGNSRRPSLLKNTYQSHSHGSLLTKETVTASATVAARDVRTMQVPQQTDEPGGEDMWSSETTSVASFTTAAEDSSSVRDDGSLPNASPTAQTEKDGVGV